MRRIWNAEIWTLDRPDTLRTMPNLPLTFTAFKAGISARKINTVEFERFRREVIRQHQSSLDLVRHYEEARAGAPSGWDIEGRLVYLARHMKPASTGSRFFQEARSIQDEFSDEQRRIIYGWLLDLTEHFPWPALDNQELWRRVCQPVDGA